MAHCKKPGGVEVSSTDTVCVDPSSFNTYADKLAKQSCCPTTVKKTCCETPAKDCCDAPASHYRTVKVCAEDNREVVLVERISQVFKSDCGFCMPACGASIRVRIDGLCDAAIGAYLWANAIGVLKIKAFFSSTSEVELENTCSGCEQAPPGTPIPGGTPFILMAPPCPSISGAGSNALYPFLAAGFTAPIEDACIDIAVTNVIGLSVNKNISINGGIYRISAIPSATVITICNDGEGLTPGTVVEYKDGEGNLIVPIVLIDSNPCLNAPTTHGKVLVCDNSTIVPIEGTQNGQVLVYDSDTEEWNARTLGIPTLNCTELTADLTLDPDLPDETAYLVQVISTADFSLGDVVMIGGTEFIVTEIVSATQIRLTPENPPTAIQTYQEGSTLCSADCCTLLQNQLDGILGEVYSNDAEPVTIPSVLTVGQSLNTAEISKTLTNNSTSRNMLVHVTFDFSWQWVITGSAGEVASVRCGSNILIDEDAGDPVAPLHTWETQGEVHASGNNRFNQNESRSAALVIPPGDSITFKALGSIEYDAGDATSITVELSNTHLTYIATAI